MLLNGKIYNPVSNACALLTDQLCSKSLSSYSVTSFSNMDSDVTGLVSITLW